jgi:hypothetical protein
MHLGRHVQQHLQFYLNKLTCVKVSALQFYLQFREAEWVEHYSHVVFGQKLSDEKEV